MREDHERQAIRRTFTRTNVPSNHISLRTALTIPVPCQLTTTEKARIQGYTRPQ